MTGLQVRGLAVALAVVAALGATLGAPIFATDYYFSDCASGGSGTQSDPWCLTHPNSGGNPTSFAAFVDGTAPDAAPGDRINLCAGPCNGSGTSTFRIKPVQTDEDGVVSLVIFRVSGQSGKPITVRPFPGETVILTGDYNGNGTYEAGTDAYNFISNKDSGDYTIQWIQIGDNSSTRLVFEKAGHSAFKLIGRSSNDLDGIGHWTFDNVEVRWVGHMMWSGHAQEPNFWHDDDGDDKSECGDSSHTDVNNNASRHAFYVRGLTGGFVVRNSLVHGVCGMIYRILTSPGPAAYFVSDNVTAYNGYVVSNHWNDKDAPSLHAQYITYRNNTFYDFGRGISLESNVRNVLIEDNNISNRGQYRVECDGHMESAIDIGEGDTSAPWAGRTRNVTVRRNRIWGSQPSTFSSYSSGCSGVAASSAFPAGALIGGVNWTAGCTLAGLCDGDVQGLIENNMLWGVGSRRSFSSRETGISADTNKPVTVRNNSMYYVNGGIYLGGAAHTVLNNIVSLWRIGGKGLYVASGAATSSVIRYNNIHDPNRPANDVVASIGGVNYDCTQFGAFGTGNRCGATVFQSVGGAPATWNVHLGSTDTANRGRGTQGAGEDIDRDPRTTPFDIGADEVESAGPPDTTPPSAPANLRVVP